MHWKKLRVLSIARRKGKTFAKDQSGVTAVEFAIVALPFLAICFSIMEVGFAHFASRMLDNAVINASRLVRTGQAKDGTISKAQFKQQICDFMPPFMCDLDRITMEVKPYPSFQAAKDLDSLYDDEGNLKDDDETAYDPGDSSNIVVVNVIYKWPLMTSFWGFTAADHGTVRHLSSTMVFRNEPWG
ncbi:TadE/TadG family type IV pilus assembly protein [Roseibium sp. SCP14]|uniref:TadE/TadG family type IV pilus assembly protein n=1 Tax=Roseibium sp. SCP14 TaxID=3141375 RepID=UPI00333D384F